MPFLNDFPDSKLYYAMCKDLVKDKNIWDDCVQEAIVEVWRAQVAKPGKAKAYYNSVARNRIKNVSRDGLFLDAPPEACGKFMIRKQEHCARRAGHPGDCRTGAALGKSGNSRRTGASHDVMRRSPGSLDQMNGWCRDE